MTVGLGTGVGLELDVVEEVLLLKLFWLAQAGAEGVWLLDGLLARVRRDGNSSRSSSRRALGFGMGNTRMSLGEEEAVHWDGEWF